MDAGTQSFRGSRINCTSDGLMRTRVCDLFVKIKKPPKNQTNKSTNQTNRRGLYGFTHRSDIS